jgi:hypothetical protein
MSRLMACGMPKVENGRAAAAGAAGLWVLEHEAAVEQAVVEVQDRAAHEELALLIDHDLHVVHLEGEIEFRRTVLVEVQHVGEPGATATLGADADPAVGWQAVFGDDARDLGRGPLGHHDAALGGLGARVAAVRSDWRCLRLREALALVVLVAHVFPQACCGVVPSALA